MSNKKTSGRVSKHQLNDSLNLSSISDQWFFTCLRTRTTQLSLTILVVGNFIIQIFHKLNFWKNCCLLHISLHKYIRRLVSLVDYLLSTFNRLRVITFWRRKIWQIQFENIVNFFKGTHKRCQRRLRLGTTDDGTRYFWSYPKSRIYRDWISEN